MRKTIWVAAIALLFSLSLQSSYAAVWGKDHFTNLPLTSHEGKEVRFFDDLIKDKVVVINFIYTTCPDVCPLETAQLVRVQRILGDRIGKDVFFYSITIDPEIDTPEVLKDYRSRYGAKWDFYTGDKDDIITIRRKLGLYIEDIEGGPKNHNVSMIIGNQKTDRWMKRQPFENPYVLADQIGNWLHGWKAPQDVKDFANAPSIPNISDGEKLFRTRCLSCHSIDGSADDKAIGPDLLGVTMRRDRTWLINWLKAPDKMLEEKDPIAMALYERYNKVAMPNMSLGKVDVMDLLDYFEEKDQLAFADEKDKENRNLVNITQKKVEPKQGSEAVGDVVVVLRAWVREAMPDARMNAGYMTLINAGTKDVALVGIETKAYKSAEVHEMKMVDGMMEMNEIPKLVVPAKGKAQLKPGGKHLMLMGPHRHMAKGETVDMTLVFDSGEKQNISVAVKSSR